MIQELSQIDSDAKVWSHLFVHFFADVVYDNGISMTLFLHSKNAVSETSGLYIQPFLWWCSALQLFRYALRVPFSDPHRYDQPPPHVRGGHSYPTLCAFSWFVPVGAPPLCLSTRGTLQFCQNPLAERFASPPARLK